MEDEDNVHWAVVTVYPMYSATNSYFVYSYDSYWDSLW
jgi:hypothetical protein